MLGLPMVELVKEMELAQDTNSGTPGHINGINGALDGSVLVQRFTGTETKHKSIDYTEKTLKNNNPSPSHVSGTRGQSRLRQIFCFGAQHH